MKNEERINRNMTLTFDFLREVVNDPSIINNVSDGSIVEFIEKGRPLLEANEQTKPDKYFQVSHHFQDTEGDGLRSRSGS